MPYNAPPTFFVPGTWEAGSSNSYKERMEKKYEKNNGRNSEWFDDREKDGADTTSTSTSFLISSSSMERSAWHPADESHTKNRNQNNVNNEGSLLNNNNDGNKSNNDDNGSSNGDNDKNKNKNSNNNDSDNSGEKNKNKLHPINQDQVRTTHDKEKTLNPGFQVDIKEILEMEKAKKQSKKYNKKAKVATYWEENPELNGLRCSTTGTGTGREDSDNGSKVGGEGRLIPHSSSDQRNRMSSTGARVSSSSSSSSSSSTTSTSLSTSTLKRVESCESFYLSVYFNFPSLRALLIQIKSEDKNKNDVKKKRKKSGKEEDIKICNTDFKFYGNGHQILWKILEKMETEINETRERERESEREKEEGGKREGEKGGSSSDQMEGNRILDANSFIKEVDLFISDPDEYFQSTISSNENSLTNVNVNDNMNVNRNDDSADNINRYDKNNENSVSNDNRKSNKNIETANSQRRKDMSRDRDRDRGYEYSFLTAVAIEIIQGNKVIGKSKLSIEFAIQDGQRVVMEYEARKEQIELLSKFRSQSTQIPSPFKNTEIVVSDSLNTEINNIVDGRIILSEDSFDSENILYDALEDRNLDGNIEVFEHLVSVNNVFNKGSVKGSDRSRDVIATVNVNTGLEIEGIEIPTNTNTNTDSSSNGNRNSNSNSNNDGDNELGKEVEKEVEEDYLGQLFLVEQRSSSLSQERATRSSTLWEDYTRRLRSNRADGLSDNSASDHSDARGGRGGGRGQRNREGDGDGGREGEEEWEGGGEERDGGSIRGRATGTEEGEGQGEGEGDAVDRVTMQDVEMLYYLQEDVDDDSADSHENHSYSNSDSNSEVFHREFDNSQFSFTFDGNAGAVLEEGEYMDEREKDQVIESRSRKSSGKYRSVLYCKRNRLCCAVLCCAVLCCAVLCCAVLCCAVLHCTVLYCVVLCCALLCFAIDFYEK